MQLMQCKHVFCVPITRVSMQPTRVWNAASSVSVLNCTGVSIIELPIVSSVLKGAAILGQPFALRSLPFRSEVKAA